MTPARRQLAQAASLAALVAVWELAVRAGWADPLFVPAPSAVARALGVVAPEALGLLGETLGKTLAAYALAVSLGVGAGLLVGGIRYLHDVLSPFLVALYALPKILVLPWILLTFGLGMTPAVVYGVLQGFFPICLLVAGGVRDIDQGPLRVARSMGATSWQLYRKVVLPAVLPAVLAGMRLGIVFCLLGVLVVEMFGGIRGMGFLLVSLANAFRAPELFAATALVSLLSIAVVLGLERLNRRLGHWR
ncbi:MAG TPA: ABC transporter permease subunit [Methylomirabilota bacterium]|jgi:NitT/TauT family transport system permease protein|nr:ABC transporter permease subunit [Methylomirabilota bacterium]